MRWGDFLTRHAPLWRVLTGLAKVARTDLNVLLAGETGTGKEVLARSIHQESPRRSGPLVAMNCGAISKRLFESTFFGYERGAFTGAVAEGRRGLLEGANGGTLFLDEIGEMPLDMQAGLLRVLEAKSFRPVGSEREVAVDCRVVAATIRPLQELVEQGTFRSDLYYRLAGARFTIPPLRERREDIFPLAEQFAQAFCAQYDLPEKTISPEAMKALEHYDWPGNARELRNVLEAAVVCSTGEIGLADLPGEVAVARPEAGRSPCCRPGKEEGRTNSRRGNRHSLREQERDLILRALARYGKVGRVAEALGISRSTLYRRFETLGIDHRLLSAGHKDSPTGGRRGGAAEGT
jgi:transcriptional regulator with PAS, ATPase and Fis domain